MTSCTDNQIRESYETSGLTPDQIAEEMSLDQAAVKAKLLQVSSKYRHECGLDTIGENEDDGLNFTSDDLRRINETILTLALTAEDEHLRFKAASYVRNDKKGRLEPVKQISNSTFNILQFNEAMQQARIGASKIRGQILDVKTV